MEIQEKPMLILVNIDVGDLERAIQFYEHAAGLKLHRRLFEGTVAEMLGAGSMPLIRMFVTPPGNGRPPFRSRYHSIGVRRVKRFCLRPKPHKAKYGTQGFGKCK